MPITSYLTVARDGFAEVEEGHSRFRCTLARVSDEEGARAVVDQVNKQHWDARHHCTAMIVGPDRGYESSSDGGEPPGTGGVPMLEELRGRELTDLVAVGSRWFGGKFLNSEQLAAGYVAATRAALDEVGTVERVLQDLCEVEIDIAAVGRLEHDLRSRGARVLGVDYTGEALLRFAIPPVARSVAEDIVDDLTSGTGRLQVIGQRWVDAGG